MKKAMTVLLTLMICACLASGALADSVTMSGTVVNTRTETVTSLYGGTISEILVSAGDKVRAGETVAELATEKVYALQDGTVQLFGETGDSAEMVTSRYGAVVYLEPACEYTISASTRNAYDLEENKIIHPGETVYLKGLTSKNTGTGLVTAVSGTSYTVEVQTGEFENSESVCIYRSEDCSTTSKIGKGSISRQDPVAYTAEGIIVRFTAENGAEVHKGDVLFETLSGTYSNATGDLCRIAAEKDGVVATMDLTVGSTLAAGDTVMTFYPDDAMRLQATVTETDLQHFHVGDAVNAEFTYLNGGDFSVNGTIEKISGIGSAESEDSEESSFTVLIIPENTENLAYGMNAVISAASGADK